MKSSLERTRRPWQQKTWPVQRGKRLGFLTFPDLEHDALPSSIATKMLSLGWSKTLLNVSLPLARFCITKTCSPLPTSTSVFECALCFFYGTEKTVCVSKPGTRF